MGKKTAIGKFLSIIQASDDDESLNQVHRSGSKVIRLK